MIILFNKKEKKVIQLFRQLQFLHNEFGVLLSQIDPISGYIALLWIHVTCLFIWIFW